MKHWKNFCSPNLTDVFLQYNGWDDHYEYIIQLSKKGKVSTTKKTIKTPPPKATGHNREKNYLLKEGLVIEPLVDMGIITKDGKICQ